jgi:ribosome-associated translation inhibitor RaiA
MNATNEDPTVIERQLRLGGGFTASERGWIVERLGALGSRLRSFHDGQVELEINVKNRGAVDQHVTLECWIIRGHRLHLVATSSAQDLPTALNEVRVEMIRQIDDAKTRTEPRSNRALRHPDALPDAE